jgi:hypothetical protein
MTDEEFQRTLDNSFTVQELLDRLSQVRDKSKPVVFLEPGYATRGDDIFSITSVVEFVSEGYVELS